MGEKWVTIFSLIKKHKALNEKETIILLGYMYFSRETKQRLIVGYQGNSAMLEE